MISTNSFNLQQSKKQVKKAAKRAGPSRQNVVRALRG